MVLLIVVTLIQATHGLILLVAVAGGVGVLAWRRWLAQQRRLELERERLARLRLASDLGHLLTLDPTSFEHVVGEVLTGVGYGPMHVVGGSGDQGADLIGTGAHGAGLIVQCKRYGPGHLVGSPDLQRLLGSLTLHHASRAMLVTTSGFSTPARQIAAKHGVELVDGPALVAMARRALPAAPKPGFRQLPTLSTTGGWASVHPPSPARGIPAQQAAQTTAPWERQYDRHSTRIPRRDQPGC